MLNIPLKKIQRKLKNTFIVLLSVYIMAGTLLYFLQETLLFRPTVLSQDFKFEFSYPFEELFLKTDDQTVINAIHFKTENPKGVILYFHGNAGDLSRWGVFTEYFVEKHYDVLVMDYRTYGKSKGVLSEKALYSDAQWCYNYLKATYNEYSITVYGRSLGTGIATYIAAKNSPKQLILETPYFSILDVAKLRFPMFPTKYLLKYKFPNYQYIKKVSCPISIVHGTDDKIVPFESGKKLYEVAPKGNTKLTLIEGGGHKNLIDYQEFHGLIQSILP